jgi:hypothetical protein
VAGYRSGSTAGKVVDDFEDRRGGYSPEKRCLQRWAVGRRSWSAAMATSCLKDGRRRLSTMWRSAVDF